MHRIMIVEDEPRIVEIYSGFLAKVGFDVLKAYGGQVAIEILNLGIHVDLILLDMKMPKVTGFDVLKEMIRLDKKIPVIILTGSLDAEKYLDELKTLNYSREDILCKPVSLFLLLEKIKQKLNVA